MKSKSLLTTQKLTCYGQDALNEAHEGTKGVSTGPICFMGCKTDSWGGDEEDRSACIPFFFKKKDEVPAWWPTQTHWTLLISPQLPCQSPPTPFVTFLMEQMARATAGHRRVSTRPAEHTCSHRPGPPSTHSRQLVGTGCGGVLVQNSDGLFLLLVSSSVSIINGSFP